MDLEDVDGGLVEGADDGASLLSILSFRPLNLKSQRIWIDLEDVDGGLVDGADDGVSFKDPMNPNFKRFIDLEDVDRGLVDGADDGAARVDDVANGPHHDRSRACVQSCHGITSF